MTGNVTNTSICVVPVESFLFPSERLERLFQLKSWSSFPPPPPIPMDFLSFPSSIFFFVSFFFCFGFRDSPQSTVQGWMSEMAWDEVNGDGDEMSRKGRDDEKAEKREERREKRGWRVPCVMVMFFFLLFIFLALSLFPPSDVRG